MKDNNGKMNTEFNLRKLLVIKIVTNARFSQLKL